MALGLRGEPSGVTKAAAVAGTLDAAACRAVMAKPALLAVELALKKLEAPSFTRRALAPAAVRLR